MSIEKLSNKMVCATLIQDLGNLVFSEPEKRVSPQYIIEMAIIYMRNFFNGVEKCNKEEVEDSKKISMKNVNLIYVAAATLLLSTKYEEAGIKLNDLINKLLVLAKMPKADKEKIKESIKSLEYIFLATFGNNKMPHPRIYIKELVDIYKLPNEFVACVNFFCTGILHYTDFIIDYKPEEVALISIYIASKWSYLELQPKNGREWFYYIMPSIKLEKIKSMSHKFLEIYHQVPTNLKVAMFKKRKSEQLQHQNKNVNPTQNNKPVSLKRKLNTKEYYQKRQRLDEPQHCNNTDNSVRNYKSQDNKPEIKPVLHRAESTPDIYNHF